MADVKSDGKNLNFRISLPTRPSPTHPNGLAGRAKLFWRVAMQFTTRSQAQLVPKLQLQLVPKLQLTTRSQAPAWECSC